MKASILNFSVLLFLFLNILPETKAQDATFSQYYANPTYLNPAMISQNSPVRFGLNYRKRTINSETNFKSFLSSFEYRIPEKNSALALQFLSDDQANGLLRDQRISLLYSYRFQISRKWRISSGMQFYSGEKSIDQNQLVFEDQISDGQIVSASKENLNELDKSYYNLAAGLLVEGEKCFFGFAMHHLNQSKDRSFDNLKLQEERKFTLHAGLNLKQKQSKYSLLSPNLIYQKQGGSSLLSLGNYFQLGQIEGGLWYRFDQALVLSLGIRFDQLNIGYSADLDLSGLQNAGAHEISIAYRLKGRQKQPEPFRRSGSVCPTF